MVSLFCRPQSNWSRSNEWQLLICTFYTSSTSSNHHSILFLKNVETKKNTQPVRGELPRRNDSECSLQLGATLIKVLCACVSCAAYLLSYSHEYYCKARPSVTLVALSLCGFSPYLLRLLIYRMVCFSLTHTHTHSTISFFSLSSFRYISYRWLGGGQSIWQIIPSCCRTLHYYYYY